MGRGVSRAALGPAVPPRDELRQPIPVSDDWARERLQSLSWFMQQPWPCEPDWSRM
jgi:hypothetical protein